MNTHVYSQWIKPDGESDTSYVKLMNFVKRPNPKCLENPRLFDVDSLYECVPALFCAYLVLETMNLNFRIPSDYSGDVESGNIYAWLLVDDIGFCEEVVITHGLDAVLDEFVVSYFKNMPKIKFQERGNPKDNPPKNKIAVNRKAFPLKIHFHSKKG